jgi:nitrite reductase (NO-forming)
VSEPAVPREATPTFLVAVVALCAALVAGGIGLVAVTHTSKSDASSAALVSETGVTDAKIELADISIEPKAITVAKGQKITLHVHNKGSLEHDLRVNGTDGTRLLKHDETQTITIGPFDTSTQAWCTVTGHKAAGMLLDINVAGTTPTASSSAATSTGPGIDMSAVPADNFQARDPNAPTDPAPAGTVHKITLTIKEAPIEIAPGVTQLMWTYNGTVPGPILRGKVGDTFEITLVNHGTTAHSIDFHASKVAPNITMRVLQPGMSYVYKFTAVRSGIFMYHCGTPPVLEHISMGMYGAIIIDPPNLAPVDHEYVMVQSELYQEADPTQPVDYNKLLNEQYDAVVFNGYVNQYVDQPINVGVNQKIRVWVIDDGPSDISSFHVIGTIFDTVYKEGAYLLQPGPDQGGGQALDVAPAQGGYVEFTLAVPGKYTFVTHKFNDAVRGAAGIFHAS